MRIALVTREYPPETPWGGIASFYVQFAQAILNRGHDVEVFAQGVYREHTEIVAGITVHRVLARQSVVGDFATGDRGGNRDLGDFAFSLAQELFRVFLLRHQLQPFDVVEGHEHLGVNAFINQYAPLNVVTVTRYHTAYHSMVKRGLVDWPASQRIRDLERLSLTAAQLRVATSGFIDTVTREDFGLAEPAPVLANFTAPFPVANVAAEQVARENLVIFVGRLVAEHKRPDLAARAFAAVAAEFPDWRIEFAGPDMDQPDGSTTWQHCAGYLAGVAADRWHYHGVLQPDGTDRLYRRAKVIIVPSRFESFGMVAIEAMHRGCVPLVSDQTALIDATADAELEFRNGNLDDLANKLRKLMVDGEGWDRHSRRCRARALETFNRDVLLQQNLRLFQSLLQRERAAKPSPAPSIPPVAPPLISIVTPSYNQGPYIEETIASLLDQGYPRFEHIVMDGGSSDGTVGILRRYPHLRWVSEQDLGQTHAINKGLLEARGEIVAYLNSDDIYRAGAFNAVARFFSANPGVNIAVGHCDIIDGESRTTGHLKAIAGGVTELVQYWRWAELHCTPQQSVFFRRSLLAEIGLFETRYHMVMDYNFWLRVARKHPFRVIDQTLAAFRIVPTTKTGGRADEMYLEEYAASREFWPALPAGLRLNVAVRARRQVARKELDVAEHVLLQTPKGRRPLALLGVAFRYWPFITFNLRYLLTLAGAVLKGPGSLSKTITRLHFRYLGYVWHRRQRQATPH